MSSKRAPYAPPGIPGYTYVKLLGSGGFADVFLYEQQRPRRQVAVKVLLQDMLSTNARRQFDGEANLMAQLSTHPSIVTIYEADIASDGRPYLAMEYCSRPNLGVSYRREPIGVADALRIGVQVAGAVETAHRAGILHRDIKPANILVTEYNRPALTDFGISATTDNASMEAEGMSIPWSPPESFADPPRSGLTTDVWALAATIYTLLAGRSPFEIPGGANGGADLISRIERAPLSRIGRADVPDSLERVLATAMAKAPESRYSSALAFARALQQVQAELRLAVTTVDVLEDVVVADAGGDDDDDPGTRIRSIVSIDPTGLLETDTTARPTRAPARPAIPAPSAEVVAPPNPTRPPVQDTILRGALPAASHPETPVWGDPPSAPAIETTLHRTPEVAAHTAPEEVAEPARRGHWGLVAAAVLVAALGGVGFAVLRGGDAPSSQAPGSTQAEAVPLDPVGNIVPAPTDLAGVVKGAEVAFTWANPSPEAGDTYAWRVPDDFGEGSYRPIGEASVTVPVSAGGRTCLEVLIVRSGKPSIEPAQACVP